MKFILKKKDEAAPAKESGIDTQRSDNVLGPSEDGPEPAQFRFLTPAEIKSNSAELSSKIVSFVLDEVTRRFSKPEEGQRITATDAMQVAMTATVIAEGILTVEAAKVGLTLDQTGKLRDTLYKATLASALLMNKKAPT